MDEPFRVKVDAIAKSVGDAKAAADAITAWLWEHVVAEDVYPRELPTELTVMVRQLQDALAHTDHAVTGGLMQFTVRALREVLLRAST